MGTKGTPTIRPKKTGGNTLTNTAALKGSIKAKSDSKGASVGTNLVYAATHQFGAERTIRAKNVKNLRFKIGDRWISKPEVHVKIPARSFLGVSDEDMAEAKELIIEQLLE